MELVIERYLQKIEEVPGNAYGEVCFNLKL